MNPSITLSGLLCMAGSMDRNTTQVFIREEEVALSEKGSPLMGIPLSELERCGRTLPPSLNKQDVTITLLPRPSGALGFSLEYTHPVNGRRELRLFHRTSPNTWGLVDLQTLPSNPPPPQANLDFDPLGR